jgi:hypothetical protein
VQHAKIVRQLGEVRLRMGKHTEAVRVLEDALARAEAVVGRAPDSRDALFERGQSEFFLGEAWRRQRDQARALGYLQRYRDTGLRLVALEPENPRWQLEAISGLHNLAVLKRDSGDLKGAKSDMQEKRLKALALLAKVPAAERGDLERKIQDASSWIGSIEEQSGNLSAALLHFEEEARGLERLLAAEPANRDWQYRRSENLSFQCGLLAVTGRAARAREAAAAGLVISRGLAAHDPENARWRRNLLRLEVRMAELTLASGDAAAAAEALDRVLPRLRAIAVGAGAEAGARLMLATALRLRGACASESGPARGFIDEAVTRAEAVVAAGGVGADAAAELAEGFLAAAALAAGRGDPGAATELARRAAAALSPNGDSLHWRVLAPLARARSALGDTAGAQSAMELLRAGGYVPLWEDGRR